MEKVYVIGGAQTDFERNWTKEGKNVIALLKEVINNALKDTNISLDDIKELNMKNKVAIFIGNFCAEYYIKQGHLGPLLTEVNEAFYGVPSARYEAACASGSVALDAAITKIKSGDYDLAICIGFELMKTVNSKICGDYLGFASLYEKEAKGHVGPYSDVGGADDGTPFSSGGGVAAIWLVHGTLFAYRIRYPLESAEGYEEPTGV